MKRLAWTGACCLLVGCGSSGDAASDTGVAPHDTATTDDASSFDAGPDAPVLDTTATDDTTTSFDASLDSTHADVPAWLDPDAHWDVPPWDTWVDETGCTKIWRHIHSAYSFGPGGVTFTNDDMLQQGDLVGDFDVTLEVTSFVRTSAAITQLTVSLFHDISVQGFSAYPPDGAHVIAYYDDTNVEVIGNDTYGVFTSDSHPATSASGTIHIARSGLSLEATVTASSGVAAKYSSATFGSGPLSVAVSPGSNVTETFRRFTVVGGGGVVRSDDFLCDSLY